MRALVEPLIPALRRYARSLLRERAEADDLVQDCLERAVTRWHQRRSDGDVRTWMFTILHNLAMNRFRQHARRGTHLPIDEMGEAEVARPPEQELGMQQAELLRALDTLPPEQRSVLLLISVEDLSYAQAARVLAIPLGTVMSRLFRARERLQRAIEGETAPGANALPNPRVSPGTRPWLRRVK